MSGYLKVELATVINADDPDKLGRVQVQYDDGLISDWLQVATSFAGPGYGMFGLQITPGNENSLPPTPEQLADGDESEQPQESPSTLALVVFAMDDRTYGYVIGFLFRWDDGASPYVIDKKKQQNVWLVKTKNGKTITLDDSDDSPSITIADENQNVITFDTKKNEISIVSQGNLTITATETLTLKGKNVEVQADEKIKLDASEIDLTAEMEAPPPPPATQPPKTPQPPKAPQ